MSGLSDIIKTQGEHGAEINQLKLDKKALFDLHNTVTVPAVAQLQTLSVNNRETTQLLKDISKEVKGISDKAARNAAASIDTTNMSKLQKVSVWTVILGFVGTVLLGAAGFAYKAVQFMIKSAAAP